MKRLFCGLAAMVVAVGCATSQRDVELAQVGASIASNYYAHVDCAPVLGVEGTNISFSITGASKISLSMPTQPKSIYPRDASALQAVGNTLERAVPWAVAGIVGYQMAQKPSVVTVHDQVPMPTQVISTPSAQ